MKGRYRSSCVVKRSRCVWWRVQADEHSNKFLDDLVEISSALTGRSTLTTIDSNAIPAPAMSETGQG